jgi:hypothetical protein
MSGLRKVWYIYTMEFYSAIKKDEIMLFAGKWMELENFRLNEVTQAQKSKVVCCPSCVEARPVSQMYI